MFFSPFSIAITSLWKERANLSAFRTFVRFALVWFCLFPLPLGVWEGLRFVIVALLGLFSYHFLKIIQKSPIICYKYNKPIRNTILNFNKLVPDLDIETSSPDS